LPRAGSLTELVTVEKRVRTKDEGGGFSGDKWEPHETRLICSIEQKLTTSTSREKYDDDTLSGVVRHMVTFRHSTRVASLTNLMRIVTRYGVIHNIRAVTHDRRRRVIVCITETSVRT